MKTVNNGQERTLKVLQLFLGTTLCKRENNTKNVV